jgi:hypothetical protein
MERISPHKKITQGDEKITQDDDKLSRNNPDRVLDTKRSFSFTSQSTQSSDHHHDNHSDDPYVLKHNEV